MCPDHGLETRSYLIDREIGGLAKTWLEPFIMPASVEVVSLEVSKDIQIDQPDRRFARPRLKSLVYLIVIRLK